MNKRAIGLAVAMILAACGGEDDKKDPAKEPPKAPPPVPKAPPSDPTPPPEAPTEAPKPVPLPELGLQIDAPGTWTVKLIKDHYTFRIPSPAGTRIPPRLDIARVKAVDKPPKTVDAAAKGCPAKVIDKKALDGGRFYYVCEQTAAGRTLQNVRLIVAETSGDVISCSGSAGDASALLAACLTLRTP